MGIQAREIVRFAKRNGMTIRRSGVATLTNGFQLSSGSCAGSVLASMHGVSNFYSSDLQSHLPGITGTDLAALEHGFEGWEDGDRNNRYYKVGQNVAKLAGLIS